ncbi:MAG: DNA sulfur modification protein DndB [Deltaproteobacteria bacterium]|nr:DNA sulfur modification protein DndB [Deltaproteobacteria bacterium]
MDAFYYTFLSLRGIQAAKEYYVSMCPLRLIPKIFLYDEEELNPELRAQRTLNKARIPDISRYIVENPKSYTFSALTASIDADIIFEPIENQGMNRNVGYLKIPMGAKFLINDGQHRRAALEEALKIKPELGDETITVVFFIDTGLRRSQQMFADLNKHAVRPTKSLGILYDHRDPLSELARNLSTAVPIFNSLTEMEKTSISNRSTKLFTLSSIYQATQALLKKKKYDEISPGEQQLAIEFWIEVSKNIPDWQAAKARKVDTATLRSEYIHAHGLALHAIGIVGAGLLELNPMDWKLKLQALKEIDWSRSNAKMWEGRAMVGGRVSKAYNNLILTVNIIKRALDLPLLKEEEHVEMQWEKGEI